MDNSQRAAALGLALVLGWTGAGLAAERPVTIRLSAAGGYDNNSGLNSERKGDWYSQETASVLYQKLMNKKAQVRLSYNALNVNYFDATDLNIFMNEFGGGVSYLLTPTTVWENDYSIQFLDFVRNEAASSYEHEVRTGIRQRINDKWMLKAGFSGSYREYTDRTLRGPEGNLHGDKQRGDTRYSIDGQLNYKIRPDLMLSLGTVLYRSDSNDQFLDYYDYNAYRVYTGVSWQISDKWFSSARLTYEYRDYADRPLVDVVDTTQADDLYTGNLSLYYKITSQLMLGANFTYREKKSNEPSQQYSGSLGTLGLYYSF